MSKNSKESFIKHIYPASSSTNNLDQKDDSYKLLKEYEKQLLNTLNGNQKDLFIQYIKVKEEFNKTQSEQNYINGVNFGIRIALETQDN